jgi:Protein of unknown function (DUF2973)
MLQILYIVAFTCLSLIAVTNLIKSMIALSQTEVKNTNRLIRRPRPTIHPELIDENGNVIDETLVVMRSLNFDDARSRLDALYESSPNSEN